MPNFDVLNVKDGDKHMLIKMWTRGVPVEDGAKDQLIDVAGMPFIFKHVAAMPDVHVGMGATIGSVIATKGAVMPSAVGVDIGCGMVAAKTNLRKEDLPEDLGRLRSLIEAKIPHGRTNNGQEGDRGAWGSVPKEASICWQAELVRGYESICVAQPKLKKPLNNEKHLGTLGTGNHFIEICLDTDDQVWIMLHSGSRGIGASIGNFYMKAAQEFCAKHFITLPNKDLAYLVEGTKLFDEYIFAVQWAQKFAWTSLELMLKAATIALAYFVKGSIVDSEVVAHCHHNFVTKEFHFGENVWVTRKGAVRAQKGDMGIIPGSMGARSFIVEGKGNPDSFNSCSHGAGRVMSRGEAFRTFTAEDHAKATEGIECRKDADVLDETPGAYKDIVAVMAAQSDLVEIKTELHQIVCVKG
jgi:tRNA-splicing ligase RtcB